MLIEIQNCKISKWGVHNTVIYINPDYIESVFLRENRHVIMMQSGLTFATEDKSIKHKLRQMLPGNVRSGE
jgi:hypothetical protein